MANQNLTKASKIIMLGCFDTKAEDFEYLFACLKDLNANIIAINLGIHKTEVDFPIDIDAEEIAEKGDASLGDLREGSDRGKALEAMANGAFNIIQSLSEDFIIKGIIGMGGGGGTYVVLKAMQSLPLGIPKLCLSTVATKDLSLQVGAKDIVLMPSIVDIAGLNRISRMLIKQAAAAIVGMASVNLEDVSFTKKTIAISMFGNTTECVNYCVDLLEAEGFEVLCFHAVGSGGRTMEALILEGLIDGVLDITTTELADELCKGICSAGDKRLEAAGLMGIPQVVVPGCLDMVNFAHKNTIPQKYADRLLYEWAPDVTLMRTNKIENEELGRTIAQKLNKAKGNVAVLLPLGGISIVSREGGPFYDAEADDALFSSLKRILNPAIEVREMNCNINDVNFAKEAVNTLLSIL